MPDPLCSAAGARRYCHRRSLCTCSSGAGARRGRYHRSLCTCSVFVYARRNCCRRSLDKHSVGAGARTAFARCGAFALHNSAPWPRPCLGCLLCDYVFHSPPNRLRAHQATFVSLACTHARPRHAAATVQPPAATAGLSVSPEGIRWPPRSLQAPRQPRPARRPRPSAPASGRDHTSRHTAAHSCCCELALGSGCAASTVQPVTAAVWMSPHKSQEAVRCGVEPIRPSPSGLGSPGGRALFKTRNVANPLLPAKNIHAFRNK